MQLLALPDDLVDLSTAAARSIADGRLDVCDQLPEVALRARRLGEEPVQPTAASASIGCRLRRRLAIRTAPGTGRCSSTSPPGTRSRRPGRAPSSARRSSRGSWRTRPAASARPSRTTPGSAVSAVRSTDRLRRWERMRGVHCHHETCGRAIFFPAPGVSSAHALLPAPRRRPAQAAHPVPRQRNPPDRGGDGPRGLHRERVDPLPPPVALPRAGGRRLRADRARRMGARDAPAPDDAHEGDRGRRRRGDGPAAPDVERRRRDLALPPDRADGLLLPQRRGRRGDLRPRGLGRRSRRSSASCPTRRATTSSSRAARPTASAPRESSAI